MNSHPPPSAALLFLLLFSLHPPSSALEILSKSRLERCSRSDDSDQLDCHNKIVLNLAVPSGSSGREASIVAQLVEVEGMENETQKMRTIRDPPVITINKTAAYALYQLSYIRDVAYKPEEFYVKTRKCEPDAGEEILHSCQALKDENGHVIEITQPVCCPCGPQRRVPSSCGSIFRKMFDGKANTAHCLRFQGDWFHVFGIGKRSLGFSVRIQVRQGSSLSEVFVGPENRTVISSDNFLRVNLIGDFAGYTSIPTFEDFYLVTPRLGAAGEPTDLGMDYSKWMLLERVRFTLDGLECNRVGVSYEAYRNQPNFCASPLWSCLHNQLWHFWEADQNQLSRNQPPQYVVEGRFERINQHPNAGTNSFSLGITEVLNSDLLVELRADDIEYVYQRSPGKILGINIPTFEALTQFGTAKVVTKNIGKLEASYSLTFHCLSGVSYMEEQFYIMKPEEVIARSFYLYPTTDQAAKYECTAILKASDFSEVDRAACQFTTTATILDNGSQIVPANVPKKKGILGVFTSIKEYICVSWVLILGLLLAIFPTVVVLLWLLHEKGFFDPVYDWWDDRYGEGTQKNVKHTKDIGHHGEDHAHGRDIKHRYEEKRRRRSHAHHVLHKHGHSEITMEDRHHHRHGSHLHVHRESPKHKHSAHHGRKSSRDEHHMREMGDFYPR